MAFGSTFRTLSFCETGIAQKTYVKSCYFSLGKIINLFFKMVKTFTDLYALKGNIYRHKVALIRAQWLTATKYKLFKSDKTLLERFS